MKQLYPFVALAMLLAGGWFFFTQFQIQKDGSVAKRPADSPLFPSSKRSGTVFGKNRDTSPRESDRPRDTRATSSGWSPSRDRDAANPRRESRSAPRVDDLDRDLEARRRTDSAASDAGRYESRGADPRLRDPRDVDPRDPRDLSRATWDGYDSRRDVGYSGGEQRQAGPRAAPRRPTGRRQTIRIASFNIQVFGEEKVSDPNITSFLAEIIRQFDVVAIQEIRARADDVMPRFMQRVNETGRRYRHVIGPREGRTNSKEQYAFVFDTDTIAIDPQSVYRIDDPDDLLHRPPLVAGFACVNAPRDEAFTFTLINTHTDPDEAKAECDVLDDVFRAVQGDGRGEDDVILLGDFNAAPRQMQHLSRMPNVRFTIVSQPTNTRGDKIYDNIIFDAAATREATTRGGVYDFLRAFNLRSEKEALAISDHMPVWAEFSVYEAGDPHHVARAGY